MSRDRLAVFMKVHEAKLQSKFYARKYERMSGRYAGNLSNAKKATTELDYHYRADGNTWRDEIIPGKKTTYEHSKDSFSRV